MLQGILKEIVESKRAEVEARKQARPMEELKDLAAAMPPVRDFATALHRGNGPVKLLAEIKGSSPSAGILRADFDPGEIARLFEECGAAAISVLTDQKYFSGTDEHLQAAREATSLPVLRKDFTIDEYQLYESRALGADAILLMAQVLDHKEYQRLFHKAYELGLHILNEGHTADQIRFLSAIGAKVIGINNRDFETLEVSLQTTLHHRQYVPHDRILVSQSGIFTREEVEQLENIGVDAIQVGTSIMKEGNMREPLDRLLGKS